MSIFGKEVNTTQQEIIEQTPVTVPDLGEDFVVQSGQTTYLLRFHFSSTSKETLNDKLFRLIQSDLTSAAEEA